MGKIKAYLGIDVGSVSTNLALLDENYNLLARRYLATAGRPIEAVRRGLLEIGAEIGENVCIAGAGTTGSGRYLIGELVGADVIKNEITAQAEGALHFDPAVDTIFEIGGQDSKFISLASGVVVDFNMNKACAAGTGSFLEEQAEKLGIKIIDEFARLALAAEKAAPLGDRCTVFIESELNHHLQSGASKEELAAGLARAIVKNYLNKVVESRRVGDNIFFQGGVAANAAVVAAFREITGRKIIVPPHHDITGAVGIAILAARARFAAGKFKGFALAEKKYEVSTFECRSCANLCEITKIKLEGEAPLFHGGRCEKYERKTAPMRSDLPELFNDLSKEERVATGKRIGLPRVLFFFEQLPFWQTFFSRLGFEVVLSDPSTPALAEAAIEKTATEACFPITLAHGHVQNLLDKRVEYLFLPSIIDAPKPAAGYTENFHCPFVQALPYFIKSGFDFPAETQVLDPVLEPQRGRGYFHRQLIRIGRNLGESKREIRAAIELAEAAQEKVILAKKKQGQEILDRIEKENLPALVIITRAYNSADQILNLNVPQKLKELGILAVPLDLLPLDTVKLAGDHPNAYWDCEKKILAAARFVGRHPKLAAIYISNFRCGPDSFIAHLVKEEMKSKPYLHIEVDGHASDTGLITRLEAFLDSLKNRASVQSGRGAQVSTARSTGRRTVYLPRMCDHAEALAAAMRAGGIEAEVLPPSDAGTLELGRRYTSGKECHPFTVTSGDFLKKIAEPGFKPENSAFFMPTASGPCRFGHYRPAQELIFKQIGYPEIPLMSSDVRNSYSRVAGLDAGFRRRAWRGILAVDVLNELTACARPYEKEQGTADNLHRDSLHKIIKTIEGGGREIFNVLSQVRADFAALPLTGVNHKPLIGVVGEIFVRYNPACNADIVRKIEKLGGRSYTAPISEWFYYTNLGFIYESWMKKRPLKLLQSLAADFFQRREEKRLGHRQPPALKLLRRAAPYLHHSFKGEAALSIGKAVELINEGAAGIINLMPFTCMPGTVVAALAKKIKEHYPGVPWLDVSLDGTEGVNLEIRLEAFMHQAFSYNESVPRPHK